MTNRCTRFKSKYDTCRHQDIFCMRLVLFLYPLISPSPCPCNLSDAPSDVKTVVEHKHGAMMPADTFVESVFSPALLWRLFFPPDSQTLPVHCFRLLTLKYFSFLWLRSQTLIFGNFVYHIQYPFKPKFYGISYICPSY